MARAKRPVLGRGLSALIPDGTDGSDVPLVLQLDVGEIEPNPYQARTDFDEEHIDELKRSIQERGVIQPITVNRVGQSYQLITGERRLRAAKKAGFDRIPAIVREIESPQELMELSLIENIQREDLNPIEEAEGYRALIANCQLTQEDVAQKVGRDRSTIANLIRLLGLPLEIQDHVRKRTLQMGHARAVLALDDEEDRLEIGRRCVEGRWSVREAERAVNARKTGRDKPRRPAPTKRPDPHLVSAEERLQHHFGTAVAIHRSTKKGRIEIEFYGDEDLQRILELLLSEGE